MRTTIIVGTLVYLMSPVFAASEQPKVTLDATDVPIAQVIEDLAKQTDAQIVCEPGIAKTVTGHFQSIELDKLLDTITKTKQLKWRKLYFRAQDDEKPTVEKLRARAELLDGITGGPMAVYDPTTGKQKVFVEQDPAAPSVEPEKLGLKAVYFIYQPKVQAKDSEKSANQDVSKRFQALQDERLKLLSEMTPEQQVAACQQEMLTMMQLSPEARQQILLAEFKARSEMDPQTREQYRDMMRDTFRAMREQGLLPDFRRGDRSPFRDRRDGGERGDRGGRRDRGG